MSNILSALEDFPNLIVTGVVDLINLVFSGISTVINGLFALLPGMSDAPSIVGGVWVNWLNWFLPVGDMLIGIASLISMYLLFLALRYALNLVKAL
ncbi:MAG: hypothetical protein WA317_00615 [Mycobacterium sp.]|uniref:hypothetical protein n=1 Tax=Mycobacterium sp. TaxID=1785 RepID=UPI003CC67236